MHKIDGPGASPTNTFVNGNPALGVQGTTVTAEWATAVQEELINILTLFGLTPIKANNAQISAGLSAYVKTFIEGSIGGSIPFTPVGAVTAGTVRLENDTVGVVAFTLGGGIGNTLLVRGKWPVPKKSTDVINPGMALYWDNVNGYATVTSTGNRLFGMANEAKISGDTTINVLFAGAPSKPA